MSTSNTTTVELEEEALNIGIQSTGRDISTRFGLDESTINTHIGQWDGQGPRYGMLPIPNHNHGELTTARPVLGLQRCESSVQWSRTRVYGVNPLSVAPGSATESEAIYFWAVAATVSDVHSFYWSYGALKNSFTDGLGLLNDTQLPTKNMDAGLANPTTVSPANNLVQNYRIWNESSLLNRTTTLLNYVKSVSFAASSRMNNQKHILGRVYSNGSVGTPPGVNFNTTGFLREFFTKNIKQQYQSFELLTLTGTASNYKTHRRYKYSPVFAAGLVLTNTASESDTRTVQMNLGPSGDAEAGYLVANAEYALFRGESFSSDSGHYLLAAAPGKAVMGVFQEKVLSSYFVTVTQQGPSIQYVSPCKMMATPPNLATLDTNSGAPFMYKEIGVVKKTCWYHWNSFDGVTPITIDPGNASPVRDDKLYLGPANSGILRRNTTYEFAFSLYDKSTAHETNVGTPALILTGNDDYTKLLLFGYITSFTPYDLPPAAGQPTFPLRQTTVDGINSEFVNRINYLQYRIYFRERGTFEWLPAAQIDAPSLYDIDNREIWICEGPFSASVGGQPGGFNDYSTLPDDAYFDVLQYRERLFWMSGKNLMFSRTQDYFSYPVTNAIACPDGSFKGMISHAYPGQAQQDSRLVIFTTGQIAIGRFQGQDYATIQTVRVSSVASAELPVDGSDFTINTWTTQTAFSSRSAVVAQGILYYWGPTGIYRDTGADLPTKEWSELIEPFLFSLYDTKRTDEIHSVYNDITKEIIWFYPVNPKLGGGQGALVYKVTWSTFHNWSFADVIIDSAQIVPAQFSHSVSKGNSGNRIMLSIRNASSGDQRAVFFDDLCDSGDLTNGNTLLVKTVAVQGANRRLTFATRAPGGALIPTSGNLTLSGYRDYRDVLTPNPDAIYPIVGSDGSTYVDIGPVAGVTFPTTETITDPSRLFPVTIESLNGFTFSVRSCYWAPRGMRSWQRWLYCYQSYKVNGLLPSQGQQIRLKFYSILGTGNSTRDLTLTDNSRGNMQAHSQIVFDQQNAEGPALSIEWTTTSGKFCGSRWYCQYLSFDITPMNMNNFKTWEA